MSPQQRVSEERKRWTCQVCHHEDVWGPTWSYYGSLAQLDTVGTKGVIIVCSEKCQKGVTASMRAQLPVVRLNGGYHATVKWPEDFAPKRRSPAGEDERP